MKKNFVYIICLFFLFPIFVEAYDCSNSDRERLQSFANNISVIIEETSDSLFSVTFTGLSNYIRIYNPTNITYYRNLSENNIGETSIGNLKPGVTYYFEVYSATDKCIFEKFRTITINMPNINPYYGDDICKNVPEYSLCQKYVQVNLSYEEFAVNVKKYIDENKENINKENYVERDNYLKFLDFYDRYYWLIFTCVMFMLTILIILWVKENKKNRL